jgi:2'-5' RNA ligase
VRLFVALDIPAVVRQALGAMVARLEKVGRGARWVRVEGIHLTLKFIGEMSDGQVPAIDAALRDVRTSGPVEARFRGVGFFPNERHPRVCWAGVEGSPNLAELAAQVDARLEKFGVERETRAFKAHLTLARFKSDDGLPRLLEEIRKIGVAEFGAMQAREFYLFRSELLPGGARYTKLAAFPFVEAQP